MLHRILLDPQGGDGNGAPAQPDLALLLKTLLAEKHGGDPTALARDLLAKNQELEKDNRRYRAKINELKKVTPEEGSVVLAAEDAGRWTKYRALGEPDEVQSSLDSGRDAATKLEGIGRAETFRKAASLGGYGADVFADLAATKGLKIEISEEKGKDGKAVEEAFVMGEGGSRTPLSQFVESHLSSYLPALKQGQSPPRRDRKDDGTPPRRSPFAPPPREEHEDETRGLVGPAAYAT